MGRGIHIGNAFEAPTETAWGNPWQPEYFVEALLNIRKTNSDCTVLLGTALFSGLAGILLIHLTDDDNVILSVLFYSPFNLTQRGTGFYQPR